MANILSKFSAGIRGFIGGFRSPGEPMRAAMPQGTPPAAWDYPYGYNLSTTPRGEEAIGFDELRALADNYDLLRLAIEKRKNQIEALEWNIVPINKRDPIAQQMSNEAYQFFRRPDRLLSFGRWQRALVEDVLVIDAPAIYVRRNIKGGIYGFELIDGATIRKNIDEMGRTPLPPYIAYQQIIEGMPAVDLTTDELLYFPRNVRTHKVYGYSNVEQIVMTVNIAIRRQISQLGCYTDGNIPEAFISCPTDWGLEQIQAFQGYWDSLFIQNQNMRRARFIPHGTQPTFYKESPLKDQFDEWLARIISYSLDLPPTALVKETNRATAETTQDAGKAEGMASLAKYLKEIYDILLQNYMGLKGVEFRFMEEEAQKPLEQAQVNEIYIRSGVLTQDEVREDLGRDPLTDEQRAAMEKAKNSAVNPYMLNGVLTTDEIRDKLGCEPLTPEQRAEIERAKVVNPRDGFRLLQNQGSEKIAKTVSADNKTRELPPLIADPKMMKQQQEKLSKALLKGFVKLKPDLLAEVGKAYEKHTAKLNKLDRETKQKITAMILDEINFDGWSILFDEAAQCLAEIAEQSGAEALAQVGITDEDITKFVDRNAAAWAKERAAEMVGMRLDGERLIVNPNPKWAITDGTRDYLRGTVARAVEEGWSPQKLMKEIADDEAIWPERAKMIAETELNMAHAEGSLIGWQASGVVTGKRSLCQHDENYQGDDPCPGNADIGVIGIDELFPSGRKAPPFHPNCKCVLVPVVDDA